MNTPLEDPTVTVTADILSKATGIQARAPRTLTLRWSTLFTYCADKWGVPLLTLLEELASKGPGKFSMTIDLFAAMVAHEFSGGAIPKPEQWAAALSDEDVKGITEAVLVVLKNRVVAMLGASQPPAKTAAQALQ